MPRTFGSKFSDQDRDDLRLLNQAIEKARQVEVDSTVSAVELGIYLKEVKDRALWKLESTAKRGSFYRWVSQRHEIKTTMIKNYLLIGDTLTTDAVSGRRISVKSLQVISRAASELRGYLIRLADAQQSSAKVRRALKAAQAALDQGASLPEAEARGQEAISQSKRPTKDPSLSIEEALQKALRHLEALEKPGAKRPTFQELEKVEGLAQEILSTLHKLKGPKPEALNPPVLEAKNPPVLEAKNPPALEAKNPPVAAPKSQETVTAVTVSDTAPKLRLLPLVVVARVLLDSMAKTNPSLGPGEQGKEAMDVEYLLRLPRPETSVLLSVPPDVPPVLRSLVDQVEPLLVRVAGLLNGRKVFESQQLDEPLMLAGKALEIAKSGVLGLHPFLCRPLEWLLCLSRICGDLDYAEDKIREILAIWRKFDTKDQSMVLEWQSCLGILFYQRGRVTEAEMLLGTVWRERKRRLPKGHPLLKQAEENLRQITSSAQVFQTR